MFESNTATHIWQWHWYVYAYFYKNFYNYKNTTSQLRCAAEFSSSLSVDTVLVWAVFQSSVSSDEVNAAADSEFKASVLSLICSVKTQLSLLIISSKSGDTSGWMSWISALVSYTLHSYSSSRSGTPWSLGTADWQEEKKVQYNVFLYSETEIKRSYCLLGSDRLVSM